MLRQYSDPVHGAVIIEDQLILELIDTKEFNRLKKVNQLGMTHYIYPGATHNRFSHSLGTYEIARKVLNRLKVDMTENTRLSILAACLLHDIGHGPMSHLFESVSPIHHEHYTIKLITDPKSEIKSVLDKYQGMSDEIISIINKTHPRTFAWQILSSQVDVDRLDYLQRDSDNCGIQYGENNIEFLIKNMKVIDDKLVFEHKSVYALESFILGRYHMYQTVYLNKKNIVLSELYTFYFNNLFEIIKTNETLLKAIPALKTLADKQELSYEEFMSLDDNTFQFLISKAELLGNENLIKIAKLLSGGKVAEAVVINSKEEEQEFISGVNKEDEGKSWAVVTISTDFKQYGASRKGDETVIEENGKLSSISEYSQIIRSSADKLESLRETRVGVKI